MLIVDPSRYKTDLKTYCRSYFTIPLFTDSECCIVTFRGGLIMFLNFFTESEERSQGHESFIYICSCVCVHPPLSAGKVLRDHNICM